MSEQNRSNPPPSSILLQNAMIITMDDAGRVFRNGAVYVSGDKIVDVGRTEDLKGKYHPEMTIDASKKFVIPGMINTHYHVDSSLFLGLGTDTKSMREWTRTPYALRCYMDQDQVGVAATLSCISNIRAGMTSAVYNCNILRKDRASNFDEVVHSVSDSGMRAIVAKLFHTEWSRARDLPFEDKVVQSEEEVVAEYKSQMERLHDKGDHRIKIWFGPNGPHTTTPQTAKRVSELANQYGVGIHTHMGEDETRFRSKYGVSPLAKYEEMGILGKRFHAVHCYNMADDDVAILARTKTNVCHNPTSNIALGSGIVPLVKMIAGGVNIALGTDGPHCLDRTDLFEVMRTGAYVQKVTHLDSSVLGNAAFTMLRMATRGGAAAMDQERDIGSVEPGKKADLAVVEMNAFNTPITDPIASLVYQTSSSDVTTTIVNGRVLMLDKKITFTDEEAVRARGQRVMSDLLDKAKGDIVPLNKYNFVD